jgi:hypothetical protein
VTSFSASRLRPLASVLRRQHAGDVAGSMQEAFVASANHYRFIAFLHGKGVAVVLVTRTSIEPERGWAALKRHLTAIGATLP